MKGNYYDDDLYSDEDYEDEYYEKKQKGSCGLLL